MICLDLYAENINKKLTYRRDSASLTSIYRKVQKTFLYVEPFRRAHKFLTDRQTEKWTDRQTTAIAYADKLISIKSRA